MMNKASEQLRKELRQAGASTAEADELLPIAFQMHLLKKEPVRATKKSPYLLRGLLKPAAFAASGLALGMILVVVSQTALPTSILYPAQKLSDGMAIDINPQYRSMVMMKRAQQVNQLVSEHASQKLVLAVLADYKVQATAYMSTPRANYSAFEFCKAILGQAASAASPVVKQAISHSLQSLEAT